LTDVVLGVQFDGPAGHEASRAARWPEKVVERLNELCSLPRGWNGYEAGPVSFSLALFAFRVLGTICGVDTPAPSIVPGASGDLQIEWHLMAGDIELHVRAPNDVVAWRLMSDTGPDGEERVLSTDFTVVARWIEDLLESSDATVGSAA
jgi:hypothetical protein